jgi:hypothetical protein
MMISIVIGLLFVYFLIKSSINKPCYEPSFNLIENARKHPWLLVTLPIGWAIAVIGLVGTTVFLGTILFMSKQLVVEGIVLLLSLVLMYGGYWAMLAPARKDSKEFILTLPGRLLTDGTSAFTKDKLHFIAVPWGLLISAFPISLAPLLITTGLFKSPFISVPWGLFVVICFSWGVTLVERRRWKQKSNFITAEEKASVASRHREESYRPEVTEHIQDLRQQQPVDYLPF